MFGPLGFWELAFILVLALLIFGPKRLPQVGKTLGKGLSEFRRATEDLKRTIEREVSVDESSLRALDPPTGTSARSSANLSGSESSDSGDDGSSSSPSDGASDATAEVPSASEASLEGAEPVKPR